MKKGPYKYYNNMIIDILLLILILILPRFIIFEAKKVIDYYTAIIIYVLLIIFVLYGIFKNIKKIKKHDEILEKGLKVQGVIVKPEKEIISEYESIPETNYYLYVKYIDPKTNQEVEFKTEKLSFNPFKRIKSNTCNVYIYDGTVIAEDFELTKNKEERIFTSTEESSKKINILVILAIILVIIGTIVLISSIVNK